MAKRETSVAYLNKVARESLNPDARRLAAFAAGQWKELLKSWDRRDEGTRRALWDLLAGVLNIARTTTLHPDMVEVVSGPDIFYFPVFFEACGRRGRTPPPGAVVTGILPLSPRMPQTAKWKNKILKT